MTTVLPKVVIIGGGFAGIAAAKALARAPVEVMIMDRRNHHVFQPLLYQVATAALSPADISAPIRTILRRQANCQVLLAEVRGIDTAAHRVDLGGAWASYDYLIVAAGATHSYFGHDQWAAVAPGLKTIEDATQLRRRILLAFESAEYEGSDESRKRALTFAIVGGGATGVELAGAIKEIAGQTLPKDYRHIDTRTTRVILYEGSDRLLQSFAPDLSAKAQQDLMRIGVEVRLGSRVTEITPQGLIAGGEFTPVRNVFWAAGVKASPLGVSLGTALDRDGRVMVGPDLSIPGHPEVFIAGDLALIHSPDTQQQVPGVAQAAMQMGHYAGSIIAGEVGAPTRPSERTPFVYRDKGSAAVIGRAKAVVQIGRLKMRGLPAWFVWGGIHIFFLIGFRDRLQVLLSWFWNWLFNARDARLITGDSQLKLEVPRSLESLGRDASK